MSEHPSAKNYSFDSLSVVEFLYKWRKPLLIVTLLAGIVSIIFTGPSFIKPRFKSTVVFYPATTNSISKALLNENAYDRSDPLAFGEEEEAEQLIQILYSDDIQSFIIEKYDLMNHYDIKPNAKFKNTQLAKKFSDNIRFRRTEYSSVEIEVLDTDPEIAAGIANDIAALLDETKNKIQREQASKALNIVETQYQAKREFVNKLNDSLNFFRALGIFDYEVQIDHITDVYVQATSGAAESRAKLKVLRDKKISESDTGIVNNEARLAGYEASSGRLQQQLDLLGKFGGAYSSVKEQLEQENEELVKLRQRFDRAKVDVDEVLPVKFVVNSAKVAEKKTYPLRSIIVLLSTFGALLMSLLVLIAVENYKFLLARQK
jgi:capsular polysaccharide biosynthesis protein